MRAITCALTFLTLATSGSAQTGFIVLSPINNGPAQVLIDGQSAGTLSTQELTLEVGAGSRSLLVQREGFAAYRTIVEVREGDVVEVNVRLLPRRVRIVEDRPIEGVGRQLMAEMRVLHLDPVRVPIVVDGQAVGETPATLEVPAGELHIRVGQAVLCLRVNPYDSALVRVRQGRLEELRKAWRCEDAAAPPAAPDPNVYTGDPVRDREELARRAELDHRARALEDSTRFVRSLVSVLGHLHETWGNYALDTNGVVWSLNNYEIGPRDKWVQFSVPRAKLLVGNRIGPCSLGLDGRVTCWDGASPNDPAVALAPRQYREVGAYQARRRPGVIASPVVFDTIISIGFGGGRGFCGIGQDHRVYCWGPSYKGNHRGQLGRGYYDRKETFGSDLVIAMPIVSEFTYSALATDRDTMCALRDGGKIDCWGDGDRGGLGRRGGRAHTPRPIDGDHTFRAFAPTGGRGAFCAEAVDGNVWCWGRYLGRRPVRRQR